MRFGVFELPKRQFEKRKRVQRLHVSRGPFEHLSHSPFALFCKAGIALIAIKRAILVRAPTCLGSILVARNSAAIPWFGEIG